MTERYTFFWDGPFSQWHRSPFQIGGVDYNCAEQYMMAQKAICFNDEASYRKIMATLNPREQKAIGRTVSNFNVERWAERAEEVVFRASYAKFTQNPELRKALNATAGTIIVEASPEDTVWGIGLGEHDPACLTRAKWKGENKLGYIVTMVRDCLQHQDELTQDVAHMAKAHVVFNDNMWYHYWKIVKEMLIQHREATT